MKLTSGLGSDNNSIWKPGIHAQGTLCRRNDKEEDEQTSIGYRKHERCTNDDYVYVAEATDTELPASVVPAQLRKDFRTMALINATSFVGSIILTYLSSFILLAIIRIATGISIQRVGLSSLRHISYTHRDGIRIDIRGLGFAIHRPTFAQPTWVSLRLQELVLTVDPASLQSHQGRRQGKDRPNYHDADKQDATSRSHESEQKSKLWRQLNDIKEHLKRIHDKIQWLRMFDIYATNTTLDVTGVGSLSVGSITLAVHTRRKMLDRGRLFRHKKDPSGHQKPAEWIFTVRSIFLGVSGREPIEILDNMSVNVHGLLYQEKSGLRDTSIAIKVGRLHVPIDDFLEFKARTSSDAERYTRRKTTSHQRGISLDDVVEELERPGSREAAIVQTVADSKEFLSSVLRGVQEIQLGMSFIRISKEIVPLRKANLPVFMNIVTHEIGIDLHRLSQNSPAHRMYFSHQDIAHQALVAAVSISVSLDEDDTKSTKIVYIPMATTTIRTTLPSKTMSFTEERDVAERNSNVLFANLVITSPSVDLTPQYLIQLLAVTQSRTKTSSVPEPSRHRLISRLLPRAVMKFSIHEPVVRFVLPVAAKGYHEPDDFDMIISAISGISFEVESSHSSQDDLLYSLNSHFRVMTHTLYYQSASGMKHNLLKTDSLEVKTQVTASKEVFVVVSGALRSFSILMVRPEVSQGVYNIVRHFHHVSYAEKTDPLPKHKESFLRKIPAWLLEFRFEGTNCSFETAGIDASISDQTRGVAFELESWSTHYLAHRTDSHHKPSSRRKVSASVRANELPENITHLTPPTSPAKHHPTTHHSTDGRRLTVHIKGFQGFIIESLEEWEQKPFVSVPRTEVAFSTSRDQQGPMCHINTHVRAFYLEFSLYRAYSIGVAAMVIQDAFWGSSSHHDSVSAKAFDHAAATTDMPSKPPSHKPVTTRELLAVDVKSGYVQIKADMPHQPAMMLQLYEVAAGRHRWSAPFLRGHLLRLHAASPHVRSAWARIISMNALRIDPRSTRKKTANGYVDEKSFDVSTDFIRLAVPHGLRMFKVFDNFTNTFKSLLQLTYRFKTRSNNYILKKGSEKPKHVPRVSLRCKALLFELEDDAFEWKLSNIYHVGRSEQKQRLARADAFKLKLRKMQDERGRQHSSRRRAQSSNAVSRETSPRTPLRRSASQDSTPRRHSPTRGRKGQPSKLRYNRDGTCNLTSSASVEVEEAWDKLQKYNARSWKSRIGWLQQMQNSTVRSIRRMFSGADEPPPDVDDHETTLGIPDRPGLLTIVISDLHLIVDKPSFPLSALPKFMNDVGKGIPQDMQYALLVPLSLSLDMGEARFMLRDYPLNLLHVPAIRRGQPPRLPSWSMRTDFVIAEEFRDDLSIRHVKVDIVPKGQRTKDGGEIPGFAIDVRRTVSPVKTYSMPIIDINTSAPTSISWGTSYQPAIQDVMMIIESFTKPEIDPSDRVGFWDKVRLSFHSRPVINWKGDGDVQLRLKGSRDPYVVTGFGAGFVMCWRSNVRWAIHEDDDPRNFMTVKSGEYVLAIPDYSHKAQFGRDDTPQHDADSLSSSDKNIAIFSKVIMKVSGNVQWKAGLVFERNTDEGGRSASFKPHYDVVLKNPAFLAKQDLQDYDAYRGFRSHHIHMSVALAAPFDREWTAQEISPSQSYNSVHLSPRFFSHFFNWWSLFSGVMSLPIRQGSLWRSPEKTSKKFGRHLATIKYGLLLSPLFIAHVYKHKDSEDYEKEVVSATGLKLRLDSFILDLHQRREWFNTVSRTKSEQLRTSAMKINRAELDFVNADLRAVSADIAGTTADDLKRATDEMLSSYQGRSTNVDMSRFTIPDHDFSWIDMDDFVELDWILPSESNPETQILPLAFTPRFTYFRQTDHGNAIHGDESRESPFGQEDTHNCVIPSRHNDPRKVQMHLIENRLKHLDEQIEAHGRNTGEHEVKVVREGDQDPSIREKHKLYQIQQKQLADKKTFLEHGLRRLAHHEYPNGIAHMMGEPTFSAHKPSNDSQSQPETPERKSLDSNAASLPSNTSNSQVDIDGLYSTPRDEFASDFNNRFIIHNAQVKWNNSLRNIILRYSHQVSQRRGFVYYMSRRAVKFILDIVDEQGKRKENKQRQNEQSATVPPTPPVASPSDERDADNVVEERIQQLLNDAKRFVSTNEVEESPQPQRRRPSTVSIDPEEKLADDFLAMNSYNMRLIAPQIQFQSEKNTTSAVLLTAKGMQMKVISIMDKERLSDDVSGLVQRRFALDMDGVQIFITNLKQLSKHIHLYAGNKYGNSPGSSWPPWASIETMFDFHIDPFGFQRVVQKTSASLRYEKYNALRLKYNEEIAEGVEGESGTKKRKESRIDHVWVDFPRLRASCDSHQYYAMYIIVIDLLMYHEPLEKTRSERLEKIMLASDFSDLRGAPEMAESLQERIRQLNELKLYFIVNARLLDKKGWQDRIDLEKDLASCEDELFFIMKAINTSQQRNDERSSQSSGFLRWYLSASQVVWHLMKERNEPLLEFQLGNATYERIDNSDGSNHNAMEIEHIRGWNLLPKALYPEIIGPYKDPQHKQITEVPKMLQLHWYMLEAIAGIPVLEEFQVTMHPIKVQLERSLGKALFEYIFPGIGSNAFDNSSFSPLMVKNMKPIEGEDDEENEKARSVVSPERVISPPDQNDLKNFSTGAIANRLQPTYNLTKSTQNGAANGTKMKGLGIGNHRIGLFGHHYSYRKDNADPGREGLSRQASSHSLNSFRTKARDNSTVSLNGDAKLVRTDSRDGRGWTLRRHDSNTDKDKEKDKKKSADDVSQMMERASNYMTLAHVKLNSFVICLSYKGQRDRNLEDLHDFVFRMPPLEYRNKTWTNLDLALHLKKDVIRALISHTGAIIGNKFSHHRPGKKQVERLREIAAGNMLVPNSDTLVNTPSVSSDRSSLFTNSDYTPPRMSFQSDGSRKLEPSPLLTTGEWSGITDSRQRANMSVGTVRPTDAGGSEGTLSSPGPTRSSEDGSPRADNWPFSPASPSRIDPLGPITSNLPRPSTGSGFIPAKSLLKDVVGRRFTNGGSPESSSSGVRPTIHKGRVRFKSHNSMERRHSQGSASAADNETFAHRARSDSFPPQRSVASKISEGDTDPKTDDDVASVGTTNAKRKVLSFGKKVMSGFKG
ncbi:Protein SABRE [Lithohypha guttulata]|uniref:Protein SABRE n=1 Tax=Lithohypha guttulata TaxID=1690604 RepID=A0AAN7T0K2_9EURO|nr:Protein SABRE [Lithohypha guttulata]